MLICKLVDEPAVLEELCAGRDLPGTEGFVVMDGPRYLGHALFRLQNGVAEVLETSIDGEEEPEALDLVVRACAAAGLRRGCPLFDVRVEDKTLAAWRRVAFGNAAGPQNAEGLLACGGKGV